MRLGKEEAKGFIEEPAQVSTPSEEQVEGRRAGDQSGARQHSPGIAAKDEPASAR